MYFDEEDLKIIQDDCTTLLERALLGKSLAAFGVDGFGEHGQSREAKHFTVNDVTVLISRRSADLTGAVMISFDNYDSQECGHVATDRNIKISINTLLKEHDIDPLCWTWAEIEYQGGDFMFLKIDVTRLL